MGFWGNAQRTQITPVAGTSVPQGAVGQYSITVNSDASALPSATQSVNFVTVTNVNFQSCYWQFMDQGLLYYVWYNIDGGGTDPMGGDVGIEIDVISLESNIGVLDATTAGLEANGYTVNEDVVDSSLSFAINDFGPNDTLMDGANNPTASFDFNVTVGLDSPGFQVFGPPADGDYPFYLFVNAQGYNPDGPDGIEIDVDPSDDATDVATDIFNALTGNTMLSNVVQTGATLTFDWITGEYGSGCSIMDTTNSGGVNTGYVFTLVSDGSQINPAPYFTFHDPKKGDFYLWMSDGTTNDPAIPGYTGYQIGFDDTTSAAAFCFGIGAPYGAFPNLGFISQNSTTIILLTNPNRGAVTATADGSSPTNFSFTTLIKGS